jgi:hypothetical protein
VNDGPGSGVNFTRFRVFNLTHDSGWITYSGDFALSGILPVGATDGVYTIEYESFDYLGNSLVQNEEIYLDNTGPTPSISVGNPNYPHPINDYYVKSTTTSSLGLTELMGSGPDISTLEFMITFIDGPSSSGWISGGTFDISSAFMQGDGNYLIEFRGRDNLGNLGPEGSIKVEVDDTPPVSTLVIGDPKYPAIVSFPLNVTGSTPFNLTATDFGGSGVSAIFYKVNFENLQNWNLIPSVTYTGSSFSLTGAEGNYSIRYWAVDNVLNQESFFEIQIIVDNSPPVTSIDFLNPNYRANATSDIFNITNYTPINITSIDGGPAPVGVDYIEYLVDDDLDLGNGDITGWVNYTGLFELTGYLDGDYAIHYHAVDLLGNIEIVKNITIIVDSSPPQTDLILNGTSYSTVGSRANNTYWITPATQLIISGDDMGNPPVGFNITQYWLDGNDLGTFEGLLEFDLSAQPHGSHALEFRSIDHLTNTEGLNVYTIIIDDAGPDIQISSTNVSLPSPIPPISAYQYNFTERDTIDFNAIDMGVPPGDVPAGVAYIEYLVIDPTDPTPTWRTISAGEFNPFEMIGNWLGDPTAGYWHNNISFRAFDNLGWEGPSVTLWIYVEGDVDPPKPPVLELRVNGNDVILEWYYITERDEDISHYLIYRSEDKRKFDFRETSIWVDTRDSIKGIDPVDDQVIPLRSTWNATDEIDDDDEYYYILRAVDQRGNIGYTSNIAGWVTLTFERGYNAFSLPLEPFDEPSASQMIADSDFANDRDTIYRYDVEHQRWLGHGKNMPASLNDFTFKINESYMIYIAENEVSYTFSGVPGTSIRYIGGVGEEEDFQESLSISNIGDDITISWDGEKAPGASEFAVYTGNSRFGQNSLTDYDKVSIDTVANTTNSWSLGDLSQGDHYFLVVARSDGRDQSGTYSIGIRIIELSQGYQSFSPALDPKPGITVGSFANGELENDRDTMYYYDREAATWLGHPKLLPENINTGNVVMGSGYLVFAHGETTKVAIIGI